MPARASAALELLWCSKIFRRKPRKRLLLAIWAEECVVGGTGNKFSAHCTVPCISLCWSKNVFVPDRKEARKAAITRPERLSSRDSTVGFLHRAKICWQTVSGNSKPMQSQIDEAENRRRSDSL